jgi:hypothetical protein
MLRRVSVVLALLALLALLTACSPSGAVGQVAQPTAAATAAPVALHASGTPAQTGEGVKVAAESPVLVQSARPLAEVVAEKNAWFAALSPNGAHIAYYLESGRGKNRTFQICVYTFDGAGKKCYNLPADKWKGYPYQLQWSPDSTMITFTENPVELGYDAHIWLLKVADGTFTNLTDNGYVGSWRQPTGTASPTVDYLPMWNPSDGKIYFWRFVSSGQYMVFTLGLYRISPTGGTPELVRDLTQALPKSAVVFKQEQFFMDGPSAMAPDGKSVAALLTSVDEMGASSTNLYQISLADATAAPKQLMASTAFTAAVPSWLAYPAFPMGVAWTSDGKNVVVMAMANDPHTPFTVFYNVNPASGTVTPVVNFKDVADPQAYLEPAPGTNIPLRYYSPWTGSLSPKGDKLLMVNDLGGVAGLLTAPLPPASALPVVSATTDAMVTSTASRSSRSQDGKVLVYGLLLTVKE